MMQCSLLSLGCVFGFASANEKTTLTALKALKIAQRRLRPEVRSKLLSVSSARVEGDFSPDAWRFVFLDLATSGHCRVVTVAAKTSSEHPDTVEAFSSSKIENVDDLLPVPQNKLAVDSDQAFEKARKEISHAEASAVEYRLLQPDGGREPMWQIYIYGPDGEPVAGFRVGAKTGAMEESKSAVLEPVR